MVKNANVSPNAVVQRIVFNLRLDDKKFKDLVMDYTKTKVKPTYGEIHLEDNDSWICVKVGNSIIDMHIYGADDSLGEDRNGNFSFDRLIKANKKLSIDGCNLFYDVESGAYEHGNTWLTSLDYDISNVRVYTSDGNNGALYALKNKLNTLEVKEVDLKKEIDLVEDKYYGFESLSRADIIAIAMYFFELGLKAQKGE